MMTEYKPGDRVRLTYEGVVDSTDSMWISVTTDDGTHIFYVLPDSPGIELISRAEDDPANDPIGSWRQDPSDGELLHKAFWNTWYGTFRTSFIDDEVANMPRVTVTVSGARCGPRVVNHGDDEPDRSRAYRSDAAVNYPIFWYDGENNAWVYGNELGRRAGGHMSWSDLQSFEDWFPLTEVS